VSAPATVSVTIDPSAPKAAAWAAALGLGGPPWAGAVDPAPAAAALAALGGIEYRPPPGCGRARLDVDPVLAVVRYAAPDGRPLGRGVSHHGPGADRPPDPTTTPAPAPPLPATAPPAAPPPFTAPAARPLPPCLVITLRQMPERRRQGVARFAAAGVPATFVDGVHGYTWGLQTDRWASAERNYRLNPGLVGCNLSHWFCWLHAYLSGWPEVLVCEDDATFGPDFHEQYWRTYDTLPADWGVWFVGSFGTESKDRRRVNDRLCTVDYPFGMQCLLIRRPALAVLLDTNQEARGHIDQQVYENTLRGAGVPFYVSWPSLVGQKTAEGHWPSSYKTADPDITPKEWESIPGMFDFHDLYAEMLTKYPGPGAVLVEVGSYLGRSVAYLGTLARQRGARVSITAVDHWRGTANEPAMMRVVRDEYGGDLFPAFLAHLDRCGLTDLVRPLRLPSVEAAATFADASIDFAFIDADHAEAAVEADIRAWLPKLKPAGTIAGHDIDFPGVRAAVSRLLPRHRRHGNCWIADPDRR
jgi:GR25 family glycosyltransferase involved in LPS biosynthesis